MTLAAAEKEEFIDVKPSTGSAANQAAAGGVAPGGAPSAAAAAVPLPPPPCADASATNEQPPPPLCHHWARGSCLHGARCRFAHPAGVVPGPAPPRRRMWGGTRAVVRNRSRATVFRAHVISAFGRDVLASGTGVLDIAGGKGEVAFQFVNLNGIPATVVDPRPLSTRKFELRTKLGLFHNSGPYGAFTDAPLEALRSDGGTKDPNHARIFLELPLIKALGALAALRRRQQQQRQQQQQQQDAKCEHGGSGDNDSSRSAEEEGRGGGQDGSRRGQEEEGQEEAECLARVRRLVLDSLRRAAAAEWTAQGLVDHENGEGEGAAEGEEEQQQQEDEGEGSAELPRDSSSGGASSDKGRQQPAAAEGGEQEAAAAGAAEVAAAAAEEGDEASFNSEEDEEEQQPPASAEEAAAVDAAITTLLACSCVTGLHPDAATEPAVALALALGIPYAVVPCCVYSALFPNRRGPDGARVGNYGQLVEYIKMVTAAAGRTCEATVLPFEGKNLCLWSPAEPREGSESGSGEGGPMLPAASSAALAADQ